MKKILITGGTGLVGKKLIALLTNNGYGIHVFTRNVPSAKTIENVQFFEWNPDTGMYDKNALQNVTAVINLAGANIAEKRWTTKRKQELLNSRVNSGKTIAKALLENPNEVKVLIQSSAIGWYKSTTENTTLKYQEEENANTDFLGQTCKAWEESIQSLSKTAIRIVTIRTSIVLDKNGGMVKELLLPMQFGVLPIFGNGKQIVPWIHNDDLCNLMFTIIKNENYKGIYNAVAPQTISQKDLIVAIAKILHKKYFLKLPIPSFILKLVLGEMSIELLKSSTIKSNKLIDEGYTFHYPTLESIQNL